MNLYCPRKKQIHLNHSETNKILYCPRKKQIYSSHFENKWILFKKQIHPRPTILRKINELYPRNKYTPLILRRINGFYIFQEASKYVSITLRQKKMDSVIILKTNTHISIISKANKIYLIHSKTTRALLLTNIQQTYI